MTTAFDRLLIDVPDLTRASEEFSALLGPLDDRHGLDLGNIRLQLQQEMGDAPRIDGLWLLDESLPLQTQQPITGDTRGLSLATSHFRDYAYRENLTATGIYAVDHVVLQTGDADACIALFRDRLGLRLALDQQMPEWGGRMLFFRHGKMTLEVIQQQEQPPAQDYFWGITYQCRDLDATLEALDERGVAHSGARTGRKPGTRVATVRSHCLGLPTLLVAPA